jgi:RNase P subunit RPR2
MIQVVLLIVSNIVSGVIAWIIAHFYYRRTSNTIPEWAKLFVEHLPVQKPSKEELLRLFQEHLDSGDVEIDPILRRVACPECGESAKNFKKEGVGNELHTVVIFSCPSCGWSEDIDVS